MSRTVEITQGPRRGGKEAGPPRTALRTPMRSSFRKTKTRKRGCGGRAREGRKKKNAVGESNGNRLQWWGKEKKTGWPGGAGCPENGSRMAQESELWSGDRRHFRTPRERE